MLKTFAYHAPSPAGIEKITKIREAYSALHTLLVENCPASRELAVAHTNLETSAMWAVKSVVCNDPASVVDMARRYPVGVVNAKGERIGGVRQMTYVEIRDMLERQAKADNAPFTFISEQALAKQIDDNPNDLLKLTITTPVPDLPT